MRAGIAAPALRMAIAMQAVAILLCMCIVLQADEPLFHFLDSRQMNAAGN
jgi:hypothetical protein